MDRNSSFTHTIWKRANIEKFLQESIFSGMIMKDMLEKYTRLFLASRLAKEHGDVFIHDCDREIEDAYSNTFLKKENVRGEEEGSFGLLRHYHNKNRAI